MFVLHTLEKILQQLADQSRGRNQRDQFKISLPDIERIPVNRLRLTEKVRMQPFDIERELLDLFGRGHGELFERQADNDDPSTDALFVSSMKQILLDTLKALPPRAYPSARLMICDQESHDLLMKLQFLSAQQATINGATDQRTNFIIYRQPYNVVAVLHLEDIIDQFNRLGRPFVKLGQDAASGKQTAQFDYSIIKQLFPYLKISDLVIVLHQIGELKLRMFTIDGRPEHQIIQFLDHFARSAILLELRTIDKQIGQHHLLFDNVTAFQPNNEQLFFDSMETLEKQAAELDGDKQKFNYHLMPPLKHLTLVAYRLVRLVQQLGWSLESITFRKGDPNGFTKVFAHILESVIKCDSRKTTKSSGANRSADQSSIIPVRLIVLDRFFDFQGLLRHADRYGSFVEQELRTHAGSMLASKRLNALDSLDTRLCFEKLEEVLDALLKFSVQGPQERSELGANVCDNQAIQKQLIIIKQMYKIMNEGYLLLRKLETSIESITTILRPLSAPLNERDQLRLVERIKRIDVAFKQLVSVKSASVKVSDALRFACMLIDVINTFLYLQPKEPARTQLIELKISIVMGKGLMAQFKSLIETRGNDLAGGQQPDLPDADKNVDVDVDQKNACIDLAERLDEFDKVSSKYSPNRSLLSLEQMIEQFYKRELDPAGYPTQKLTTPTTSGFIRSNLRNKIIVLTLGSMSFDELHRVKLLETRLTGANYATGPRETPKRANHNQRSQLVPPKNILTIACNYIRPDEFIYSL